MPKSDPQIDLSCFDQDLTLLMKEDRNGDQQWKVVGS